MYDTPAKKNRDIEVLRCIAIVFTIIQHLSLSLPMQAPWNEFFGDSINLWTGVDLFFVISGYVITRTLMPLYSPAVDSSKKSIIYGFWLKRIFRLLPTAWIWLFIPLILSLFVAYPPTTQVFHGVLAGILQVYNLYLAHCVATDTLFTQCGSLFVAGHYWSLSLEEQFYIFLPLIFAVVPSHKFMKFIVIAIVFLFFWERQLYSYGWYFRVDGFLWGVLISLFSLEFPKRYLSIRPAFFDKTPGRISCTVILILILGSAANIPFLSSVAAIAVVCAILVWLASYDNGYIFGNARYSDIMVAIGARSYSLYVIHLPIFYLTSSTFGKFALTEFSSTAANIFSCLLALFFLLFFTELNYRYIEIPIRDRGRKIAKKLTSAK